MSEPICWKCRYWVADYDPRERVTLEEPPINRDPMNGECHRHAPRPVILGVVEIADPQTIWPETAPLDGCGDWEPM